MKNTNNKDGSKRKVRGDYTITKFFFSIVKEELWLEEMALKGYKLIGMTMGVKYTFKKIEPTRLIYEVDRFDVPLNPTLAEIEYKEEFMDMAKQMGWEVVLHDEDMNYYFCKEYVEGEPYELYNDETSRKMHADKLKKRFCSQEKSMVYFALVGQMMLMFLFLIVRMQTDAFVKVYTVFVVVYTILVLLSAIAMRKYGEYLYDEFKISKEDWLNLHENNKNNVKTIKKILVRRKSIKKFLEKQSEQGWNVVKIGSLKYTFQKSKDLSMKYKYIMDSKYLTNKRLTRAGLDKIVDHRDLNDLSNDWQYASYKEANGLGWEFVSAYKNKLILYRADCDKDVKQLNYNGKQPFAGILSNKAGYFVVVCVLIGFIGGFVAGVLLK